MCWYSERGSCCVPRAKTSVHGTRTAGHLETDTTGRAHHWHRSQVFCRNFLFSLFMSLSFSFSLLGLFSCLVFLPVLSVFPSFLFFLFHLHHLIVVSVLLRYNLVLFITEEWFLRDRYTAHNSGINSQIAHPIRRKRSKLRFAYDPTPTTMYRAPASVRHDSTRAKNEPANFSL